MRRRVERGKRRGRREAGRRRKRQRAWGADDESGDDEKTLEKTGEELFWGAAY
jgi:hypothetical protein